MSEKRRFCKRVLWLATGLLLAYAVGCGPSPVVSGDATKRPTARAGTAGKGFPLVLTDDAGRKVAIAQPPRRIVSLAPSNTEILFALGLGSQVVGVDQYSDYPPQAWQKPRFGNFSNPGVEQIIGAGPDLILAVGYHEKTVVPDFEARHLAVLVLEPKNLDAVLRDIALVGQATGRNTQAADLIHTLRRRIDAVTARVQGAARPRVYIELDPLLYTAGPGSFLDDLITRAGGENIAADAGSPWPQISQETLVLKNPDVILLGDPGARESPKTVRARPGWQSLRAVRQGRIYPIPADLTNRPGPRVVEGLEAIAHALHPETQPRR